MDDLKKIVDMLKRANVDDNAVVNEAIERLDALAAQTKHGSMPQKLAHKLQAFAAEPEGTVNWSMIAWSIHRMLNAQPIDAPPPSPVSMAELEKALDKLVTEAMRYAVDHIPESMVDAARAEVLRLASQGVRPRVPEWQPIETAPKDGTSVLLLIDGAVHALHDDEHAVSIGSYGVNGGPEEDPTWCFAGWSWSHDEYVRGGGTPIGWMPLPALGIEVHP